MMKLLAILPYPLFSTVQKYKKDNSKLISHNQTHQTAKKLSRFHL